MRVKKGISLIILIITIIVILILTGTIISSIVNNNLFQSAKDAVDKYSAASQNEKLMLENLEDLLNNDQKDIVEVPEIVDIPGELETEDDEIYYINCIEDLVAFSNNVNDGESYIEKQIILSRNLDFESDDSYVDSSNTELFGDYNGDGNIESIKTELSKGKGFIPIGNLATYNTSTNVITGKYFRGIFEGNNKVIQNIYINKSSTTIDIANVGLFSVGSGTIKNLSISGNISLATTATSGNACAGGIIGTGIAVNITNCNSLANISITNCSTATALIGGISGGLRGKSVIDNSRNYANIKIGTCNSHVYIGGISGSILTDSIIKRSSNNVNIENTKNTNGYVSSGGIVGGTYATTKVYKCYNNGNITMNGNYSSQIIRTGGIVGTNIGVIEAVYNKGDIASIGISKCRYCISGGIAGNNSGTVGNSYSTGNITVANASTLFRGGICGEGTNCSSCYYLTGTATGGVKGSNITGGAEVRTEAQMKSQDFAKVVGEAYKYNSADDGYPVFEDKYEYSCYALDSSTSITGTIDTKQGDLIVATIISRSDTTIPQGWQRIDTQTRLAQNGINQYLTFAYKYADSQAETITVTQTKSDRMYLNLISITGATNIETVDNLDMIFTGRTISFPNKPCNDLLLWTCHIIYAPSASSEKRWSTAPYIPEISLLPGYSVERVVNFLDFSSLGTNRTITRLEIDDSSLSQIVALKITLSN